LRPRLKAWLGGRALLPGSRPLLAAMEKSNLGPPADLASAGLGGASRFPAAEVCYNTCSISMNSMGFRICALTRCRRIAPREPIMDSQHCGLFRPRWSWGLVALACLHSPTVDTWRSLTTAAEPTAMVQLAGEIEMLIEQFSSPSFAVREAASKRLLEIGAPALELLRKVETHPSLEVRERAGQICNEIDKLVFEGITKNFLLDADATQSYGLPAWSEFREIAGASRTSKLLFVMMLRNQRELATFVAAAGAAKESSDSAARLQQLEVRTALEAERLRSKSIRGQLPDVGDAVGLLLACSMFEDTAPIDVNQTILSALYGRAMGEYFLKAGYGRCMRALAGRWITKTQAAQADDVLSIALQRGIAEAAIVARRHLDETSDLETRVRAFQCLSRFGNEADIASVAVYLKDESVALEFAERVGDAQVEFGAPPGFQQKQPARKGERLMIARVSDLALAVCMVLGSEDVTSVFPKYEPNEINGILLMDVAFAADEQEYHQLAITRWQQEHTALNQKAN